VSSATVRNEMTVLEREGYIVAPHTSAGRIPTDRGYRYFVDHVERRTGLPPAQRRAVSEFFNVFASAHQVLEDLLHETSQLLARVSTHTAVVMGPGVAEAVTVRSVQLVSLQPSVVLVLAVLSNGSVEKCTLHVAPELDDATIATAAALLDTQLAGSRGTRSSPARGLGVVAADSLPTMPTRRCAAGSARPPRASLSSG
jgi:heat-inducible transcriptional repressor